MNRFAIAALVTAAVASTTLAQSFFESGASGTFATPTPWATDRFAPATWTPGATDPIGGTALRLGVSNADRDGSRGSLNGAFYSTQGRQRTSSIAGQWEVGGELFIPASWTAAGNLRRSDIWARDNNPVEGNARYLIVGFINNDPNDGFNPAATGFAPRFRTWDSTIGWTNLSVPVVTGGYNAFRIVNTGSQHDYYINGSLVASNTGASYSDLGFSDLQSTFLQAFNFGNTSNALSLPDSGYDAHWRNVYAAVPTPGAAALMGIAGLAATRRRR